MGFLVDDNGLVSVDHGSKSHGNTRVDSNPTSTSTHCKNNPMLVYSIFVRHKNRTDKRAVGDNCPLIYALKNKENLSVSYTLIKPLVPNLNSIIDKFVQEQNTNDIFYDAVIPMPSSHSIAKILAARISNRLDSKLVPDVFRKTTSQDINLQLLQDNFTGKMIPHGARSSIFNAVSKAKQVDAICLFSPLNGRIRRK